MGTSNAERQAAWRERRDAELQRLRAENAELRKAQPQTPSPKDREELQHLRNWQRIQEQVHQYALAQLEAKHAKELEKLRRQYAKGGSGNGVVAARLWPHMKSPAGYTKEEWRKRLLKLFHPDKYHGTELEGLANEVGKWLNSLKPKKK